MSNIRMEHVAMYVRDLERAKDFFTKYFGAEIGVLYQNPLSGFQSYFATFSDGSRLELMHRANVVNVNNSVYRMGYVHIAFSVGSEEAVDELTARLAGDGYQISNGPRVTGDGYYESCIIDMEGNQIEITV